jgi:cation diffusion facilitator family transporter
MITLLSKWFIYNRENTTDPAVRRAYGTLCGVAGIVLNLLLFAGKYFAGILSGSIAITADAFNNLSDAGSSLVTLIGFKLSGRKPDPQHPFGHGRIEYISGLIVSALILLMGVELGKTSIDKILHQSPVEFSLLSVGILAISIAVKVYMSCYNRGVGRKIHSAAMAATATDSLGDTAATTAVLLATLVGKFTGWQIDGWMGVLVALFILYAGFNAARETLSPLLGQTPDEELVHSIEKLVMSFPPILAIHDMVVHDYGPGRMMISLHAEVPADHDILELHDVIDNAEVALKTSLQCEAVIHMDPVVADDSRVAALRQQVAALVKTIDEKISIHDFRMVPGPTHTNLIFDAVIPFNASKSNEEIEQKIKTLVEDMEGSYFAVVTVENSYVKY